MLPKDLEPWAGFAAQQAQQVEYKPQGVLLAHHGKLQILMDQVAVVVAVLVERTTAAGRTLAAVAEVDTEVEQRQEGLGLVFVLVVELRKHKSCPRRRKVEV